MPARRSGCARAPSTRSCACTAGTCGCSSSPRARSEGWARAGVLREVRGQDDARAVPGIAGLEISIGRDRPVRPLPEGDRYLGFLFARGETPAEVEHALRAAHERLEIDIAETAAGERSEPATARG